ncbi:gamma-glutamyltransferase family protein [Siminovitchia sediminis]|uniref:Gamma-glutamyltransferase family protein n=1 Tax=Siminovitchia sediminis TaxID=1274353 RepID=A0ABW4KLI7_9BACI
MPEQGLVSAAHPLAAKAGKTMLTDHHGNAIDAAIATAFALGVVDPGNSGIGGYGGMAVIYLAEEKKVQVVDFNTKLPLMAAAGNLEPPAQRKTGYKAISVPGVVSGLHMMHKHFGSVDWKNLISPSIKLAKEGITINQTLEEMLREPHIKNFPHTVHEFFDQNQKPLKKGDRLTRPDLANTLEAISLHGPHIFYEGQIGQTIVDDIQNNGGYLSMEDLTSYRPALKEPINIHYKGYDIFGPPDYSGSFTMMQTLMLLKDAELPPNRSSPMIHTVAKAMGRAWKDRRQVRGDKKSVLHLLKENTMNPLLESGPIHSKPTDQQGHTTHVSTADSKGNLVALTLTHGPLWFGSGITIPGTGIVMNNGMVLFRSKGHEALTNLTPTIVLHEDNPFLTIGTPGATKIITLVTTSLIDLIDFQVSIKEALSQTRFHFEGDCLYIEDDIPAYARMELETIGYRVKPLKRSDYYGPATGIKVTKTENGYLFESAVDPRFEGGYY